MKTKMSESDRFNMKVIELENEAYRALIRLANNGIKMNDKRIAEDYTEKFMPVNAKRRKKENYR